MTRSIAATTIVLLLVVTHTSADSSSWKNLWKSDSRYNSQYSKPDLSSPSQRQRQTQQRRDPNESGIEVDIFNTRRDNKRVSTSTSSSSGYTGEDASGNDKDKSSPEYQYYQSPFQSASGLRRRKRKSTSGSNNIGSGGRRHFTRSGTGTEPHYRNNSPILNLKEWITLNFPRIKCGMQPSSTVKISKTFFPLQTKLKIGADFNSHLGVWQFNTSWEDRIIGGRLIVAGRELQYYKTWMLNGGQGLMGDLVTRLCLRAAVDIDTMKAHARFGFRTERFMPIHISEGFNWARKFPLDPNGNLSVELKANFAFPEPEIEFSTENHKSFVGMGDIEMNIEELNFCLEY